MKINSARIKNFGFGFLQSSVILFNYISTISHDHHQEQVEWSTTDDITLLLLHFLFALLLAWGFSFVKNRYYRRMLTYYYLIGYLCYFFEINLLITLVICGLVSVKPIGNLITKFSARFYRALIAFAVSFVAFLYIDIFRTQAELGKHVTFYEKPYQITEADKEALKNKPKNVFFILFDLYQFQELFTQPYSAQRYPIINSFASKATFFTHAYSAYDHTHTSIPRILGLEENAYPDLGNMVDFFNHHKYKTNVIGDYIYYCKKIPNLHYCKTFHLFKLESNIPYFIRSFFEHFYYIPISGEHFYKVWFGRYHRFLEAKRLDKAIDLTMDYFDDAMDKLEGNNFVYLHWPIPHGPTIFNRNGPIPDKEIWERNSYIEKNYHGMCDATYMEYFKGNNEYADVILGRMIAKLKAKGLYEDSMIILTGDHGHQRDYRLYTGLMKDPPSDAVWKLLKKAYPAMPPEYVHTIQACHIPFVVKMPHQNEGEVWGNLISNSRLFSLSDSYVFSKNIELDRERLRSLDARNIFVLPRKESFQAKQPKFPVISNLLEAFMSPKEKTQSHNH